MQDNLELQDKIILKPELILSSVAECLQAPIRKETLQQKIAQLEDLKCAFLFLNFFSHLMLSHNF